MLRARRGRIGPRALPMIWMRTSEVLLARGADPLAETTDEYATPAAWAALGSSWWRSPGFDYVGVMELLVAAGAMLEPRFLDVAHGPLEEWLDERLG